MNRAPIRASLRSVRRLAVANQHLGPRRRRRSRSEEILSVVRELGFVQWDPVSIVAPSHLISLWNRVDAFRASDLERLLWVDKKLFEHWTPLASIVLTEDYPLYHSLMRRYPGSLSKSWGSHRIRAQRFLDDHRDLRARILRRLREGPCTLGDFEDHARTRRNDGEWTPTSTVAHMLFHLLMSGDVMVVGHQGNQNLWGLAERFLPSWVDQTALSEEAAEQEAAVRAIHALGTATPREITLYFVRGRYANLKATLRRLEEGSRIRRVEVEGLTGREERYLLAEDEPVLDSVSSSAWEPRLSLLPPFDNMLGHIERTKRLFDFDYVREQFLPKEKRRYGTYVLPILWGERFIGRIDPRLDKARGELAIQAVHAEPGAPRDREVVAEIGATIERFASFLGASRVSYSGRVPAIWKGTLR